MSRDLPTATTCAFSALSRSVGFAILLACTILNVQHAVAANTVTVGGLTYVNKGLVGVGRLAADLRDKFGETFGSGSGLAVDPRSWSRAGSGYRGTLYMLPDRGYNIGGTEDYRARLYKLTFVFKPPADPSALPVKARQNTLQLTLADTILLRDFGGRPLSGLDPTVDSMRRARNGFPVMPQATNGTLTLRPWS